MLTTDFVPGSPCFLDLGAPDTATAAAFYGAVFGWEFRSFGPEAEGGGFFRMNGRTVGALGPLTEQGAHSAWTIYFHTHDAQDTARTVEQLGGSVRVAPFDIDGEGRMAQLSDPLGGQFAVWQPGSTRGVDAVDEPGTLNWTELCTSDMPSSKEFYGRLFGWKTEDVRMPGGEGTYSVITPADGGQDRAQGGIVELPAQYLTQAGGRPYWHPVFRVVDCDATVAGVSGNDGTVKMGPDDAEGVGRLAVCLDPAGAEFVVLNPS